MSIQENAMKQKRNYTAVALAALMLLAGGGG